MDLLWLDGDLVIAGPDTSAYASATTTQRAVVGVRLSGGVGPSALGVPAYDVRNVRVSVADVWGVRTARCLRQRMDTAADPGLELERIIGVRLESSPADPMLQFIDDLARRGATVSSMAEAAGLSDRQLRRRTHAAFGYGLKTLSRIHRFQAALEFVRAGMPAAGAAVRAGYSDQPHLAREVRALTGESMSALLGPVTDHDHANKSMPLPSGSSIVAYR